MLWQASGPLPRQLGLFFAVISGCFPLFLLILFRVSALPIALHQAFLLGNIYWVVTSTPCSFRWRARNCLWCKHGAAQFSGYAGVPCALTTNGRIGMSGLACSCRQRNPLGRKRRSGWRLCVLPALAVSTSTKPRAPPALPI